MDFSGKEMTPEEIKVLWESYENGDTRAAWEALPMLLDNLEILQWLYKAQSRRILELQNRIHEAKNVLLLCAADRETKPVPGSMLLWQTGPTKSAVKALEFLEKWK